MEPVATRAPAQRELQEYPVLVQGSRFFSFFLLLTFLLQFLNLVTTYSEQNKMTASNLAIVITPNVVSNQGIAYRIGLLSNAEISDFFVYRIVYRIEPPISNISIFSKPMIFLSFFAENSKNSPKILKIPRKFRKPMNQSRQQQQQRRKFQKFAENSKNSPKILKIRRKFLKKKVFSEALILYRYRIVSRKNPNIVSISYRVK